MRHAPFVHFVAIVTLAVALFVVGLARGGSTLVEQLLKSLEGEVQMTLYLKAGAAPVDIQAAVAEVTREAGVLPRVVTPEEALARLAGELGEAGNVLRGVSDNPLPVTLELPIPREQRGLEALRGLSTRLGAVPSVTAVDYGEEAVERLSGIARVLKLLGGLALGVVFIATLVIVSATLQLAIYARREEVEIQKLVGATDRFVKAPFLIEGCIQGLLGALCALGGLWAFFFWTQPHLASVFSFLRLAHAGGSPLNGLLVVELLALGAALGLGGSFLAVGRFLKV